MAEVTDPLVIKNDLTALQATPPSQSQGSPFSPVGTTSESSYLEGLTYDRNPDYVKAVNQGFFASMGNSLVQAGAGMGLEVVEGIGYLGVGKLADKVLGTEQEFGNSLSNKMREWNEDLRQKGVPVYTTPDDEGFKPWDYKWWAVNAPSIASAVSLLIPAAGAIKTIGKAGRALGGLNLAKKLGITTEALGAGEAIGMAALSRHMEGMMEGLEVYETVKQQALDAGKGEIEAGEIAAKGAQEVYQNNWPLIATDIIQFGLAFKSFGALSRINAVEKASKSILAKVGIQAGLEAGEEGYQFVVGEEAKRNATVNSGVIKDDYSTYGERMLDYIANGDFWTSAFFGALGGAAFEGVGSVMEGKALQKQKIVKDAQSAAIEEITAVFKNDPIAFKKSTDRTLTKIMLSGIEAGRADKVEELFNIMKEGKIEGENDAELKQKAETALSDLKYLEEVYNGIFKDPTKINTQELTRFELANRAAIRTNTRLAKASQEVQTEALNQIREERNLGPSDVLLLEAQTELEVLNNDFKDETTAENDVRKKRVEGLQKKIAQLRDTIRTNEAIDDAAID